MWLYTTSQRSSAPCSLWANQASISWETWTKHDQKWATEIKRENVELKDSIQVYLVGGGGGKKPPWMFGEKKLFF